MNRTDLLIHPALRQNEARREVERFKGAALTHLLSLSLLHRKCQREVCAVCEHAVRVNDFVNGGEP